ncbi:MAG TPA: hypothetical protein VF920_00720 [Dongiaceae bacterium]
MKISFNAAQTVHVVDDQMPIIAALWAISYDGGPIIEAFGCDFSTAAAATKFWRDFCPDHGRFIEKAIA